MRVFSSPTERDFSPIFGSQLVSKIEVAAQHLEREVLLPRLRAMTRLEANENARGAVQPGSGAESITPMGDLREKLAASTSEVDRLHKEVRVLQADAAHSRRRAVALEIELHEVRSGTLLPPFPDPPGESSFRLEDPLERRLRDLEESLRRQLPPYGALENGIISALSVKGEQLSPGGMWRNDVATPTAGHCPQNSSMDKSYSLADRAVPAYIESAQHNADRGREERQRLLKEMMSREHDKDRRRPLRVLNNSSEHSEGHATAFQSRKAAMSTMSGCQALFRTPADSSLSAGNRGPSSPVAISGRLVDLSNLGRGMGHVLGYLSHSPLRVSPSRNVPHSPV